MAIQLVASCFGAFTFAASAAVVSIKENFALGTTLPQINLLKATVRDRLLDPTTMPNRSSNLLTTQGILKIGRRVKRGAQLGTLTPLPSI